MANFEIVKRPNGEFQFTLRGTGGTIILSSDGGYRTKDNCKKGIDSVRRNSTDRSKFEIMRNQSGRPYFILKSQNGRAIGISELLVDEASLQSAIRAVRNWAPQAKINDLTKRKDNY